MGDDDEARGGGAPAGEGRASAGGWIAGSIVALFVGWWVALASVLSTAGPWSGRWSDGGMLLAYGSRRCSASACRYGASSGCAGSSVTAVRRASSVRRCACS